MSLGRMSLAQVSRGKVTFAAALLAVMPFASILIGTPAHAASYRYWSYWWVDQGTWVFATAGPASSAPADGAVEGWRFGITGLAGSSADAPGLDPKVASASPWSSIPVRLPSHQLAINQESQSSGAQALRWMPTGTRYCEALPRSAPRTASCARSAATPRADARRSFPMNSQRSRTPR